MRALFLIALVASVSALSLPLVGDLLGQLPLLGPILGGSGGGLPLVGNLPLLGSILNTLGGTLGQLLDGILQNVAIILAAVLDIARDALVAVAVIVNGLLNGLLNSAQVQQILQGLGLPPEVLSLVNNLVSAVQCIVNQLPGLVPPVKTAVIQLISVLTNPVFATSPAPTQLSIILQIVGQLTQSEISQVQQILQTLAVSIPFPSPIIPNSGWTQRRSRLPRRPRHRHPPADPSRRTRQSSRHHRWWLSSRSHHSLRSRTLNLRNRDFSSCETSLSNNKLLSTRYRQFSNQMIYL